ncbi:MAG: SDR family oxidoreductase [Sumerlaeia bacterium]
MDLEITGHAAIVQGASKGIGLGIARSLVEEGAHVLLTGRTEGPLASAAGELAALGRGRAEYAVCDSGDPAASASLAARAAKLFGRLDIVVCNSGGPPPGNFADLGLDAWRGASELLLISPVALLQAALPHLRKSPAGRFFVVTSSSTKAPIPGLTLSNVLRPGVLGLIKSLSQELAPHGICCHSLAPGRIDTDRLAMLFEKQATAAGISAAEQRQRVERSIPAGRLGATRDLGSLAAFLCSPQASYLNGGNWLVDGGLISSL